MDNIFIERLWRSIKYEEIHLKAYADGREARAGISSWMTFYNFRRPHQALDNQMPMASGKRVSTRSRRREGCGYAASLGQRKRVAHIPTAKQKQQERLNLFLKDKSRRDYTLSPSPVSANGSTSYLELAPGNDRLRAGLAEVQRALSEIEDADGAQSSSMPSHAGLAAAGAAGRRRSLAMNGGLWRSAKSRST